MGVNLIRFETEAGQRWGVVQGTEVVPLSGDYSTTAELIERGENDWRNPRGEVIALAKLSSSSRRLPLPAVGGSARGRSRSPS
jgi:hypothetical protein